MVRRTVIWVDYKNRSEAWWQALWTRLEEDPQAVPAPLRQLTRPNGSDRIEVTPAEARNVLEWAATLPGWSGGPRAAPTPLRVEQVR